MEVASFVLIGCSAGGDAETPTSPDNGNDLAAVEVTPFGAWSAETDKAVELLVAEDGSFEFKPCSATGNWSDEGDHFSAEIESLLAVGGCPETIVLSLIDRITVEGETLVVSDSIGN